jgi:cytochrome b
MPLSYLSEVITLINLFFCLNIDNQIAEVVNCMKDLIDHSRQTGSGPIGAVLLTFFVPFLLLNVFLL